MNKIIILITLIPWLLYFIFLTKNNIIILRKNHYNLFSISIKNLISIKSILLFILFIVISIFYRKVAQIELINSLLFSTINIFLFIYSYYENNNYQVNLLLKEKLYLLSLSIIMFTITAISLNFNNCLYTYIILFTSSILNIILLYISKKIINIVRRINNETKQL